MPGIFFCKSQAISHDPGIRMESVNAVSQPATGKFEGRDIVKGVYQARRDDSSLWARVLSAAIFTQQGYRCDDRTDMSEYVFESINACRIGFLSCQGTKPK